MQSCRIPIEGLLGERLLHLTLGVFGAIGHVCRCRLDHCHPAETVCDIEPWQFKTIAQLPNTSIDEYMHNLKVLLT